MIHADDCTWFALPFLASALAFGCSGNRATPSPHAGHEPNQVTSTDAAELPSWREGPTRDAIIRFVTRVTTASDPGFVPSSERIATFDNDGTLWAEQPIYTQIAFTSERVKTHVEAHPHLRDVQPFKAVLDNDWATVAEGGEQERLQLMSALYAGMTTDEFDSTVRRWLGTAQHPRFGRLYTELVYQPMLELLDYLRAHDFKVFIVSGGGVDFTRPWAERVYGVPSEQVIGSRIVVEYDDTPPPSLRRSHAIDLVDDRAGKPVGIHQAIGRRPIAAFGNSDADYEMLAWTTSGPGARFGLLVHHTDAEREWAYDRNASAGKLSRALDAATERGWVVVDMKRDWRRVFAFTP